ncbi:hypothetical protein EPO33_02125 [Patescibacteria group bacterium]|nr:MAG: hypothetical protein EPO33_02125 [Patescibacteria group bacterium]
MDTEKNENQKITVARKVLKSVHEAVGNVLRLLEESEPMKPEQVDQLMSELRAAVPAAENGGRVVEGVFDGQHMVGDDGKQYHVPPNYASKSKLVEGDRLKVTISPSGQFLFKQIGPAPRERLVGKLVQDPTSRLFAVVANDHKWNVITASITYFRGEAGDEVMIVVPQGTSSKWAAVDHVIKA